MIRILHGFSQVLLRDLQADSIDACVTDPPYHLTQASRGGHARTNNPETPHGRYRIGDKGFMGKVWDGGDIAMRPEFWAEVLRVLKPGAHLLAFGGTRTHHRVWCAIEDAGFEVRDTLGWLYGSGFPKSHNGEWGGTALKPAWEPIILARKPLAGTVEANWREHGTGALNIDACRVGATKEVSASVIRASGGSSLSGSVDGSLRKESGDESGHNPNVGRWPANIIHDGSDEVAGIFPEESGAFAPVTGTEPSNSTNSVFGQINRQASNAFHGDRRSAARFFYCAKPSKAEREIGLIGRVGRTNYHPTVKPVTLMRYLVRLVTPPHGVVLDPFCGSGTTPLACIAEGFSCIAIEQEAEYVDIAKARCAWDAPLFAGEAAE